MEGHRRPAVTHPGGRPRREGRRGVLVWTAVAIAGVLAALAVRSMAYAFSTAVAQTTRDSNLRAHAIVASDHPTSSRLGPSEIWLLTIEILFSVAIMLMILGLTLAAAMPLHLMVGALLAQVAVIGALLAPPVSHQLGSVAIRPAALALGMAQIAHVAFLIRAIQALLG